MKDSGLSDTFAASGKRGNSVIQINLFRIKVYVHDSSQLRTFAIKWKKEAVFTSNLETREIHQQIERTRDNIFFFPNHSRTRLHGSRINNEEENLREFAEYDIF